MYSSIKNSYAVYLTAAFVSVILSFWISNHETVINPDAICYLQSAATAHQGLSAVMSLCDQSKWPFYSFIIAGLAGLTNISYLNAAYILNGFFSLLTVLIFMRITQFFTTNKLILWFAAGVILLNHELNTMKGDIIRDHGFWAFYLLSILFLLRFSASSARLSGHPAACPQDPKDTADGSHGQTAGRPKANKCLDAIGWGFSLSVATLFRIEGILFLLFLPFLMLVLKPSVISRLRGFIYLNTCSIIGGIFLLLIAVYDPHISFGRLHELAPYFSYSHFYQNIVQDNIRRADGLGQFVLGRSYGDRYTIYIFTMVCWYLTILVTTLSLIYTMLFLYSGIRKLLPADKKSQWVLWSYITINFITTLFFLFQNEFLSKRYIMALVLTLMLWIPFALYDLWRQWPRRKAAFAISALLIATLGMSGVFQFGHSKQYLLDAGNWLADNAQNKSIYSNDYQVMYYSQHFGNDIFAKQKEFSDLKVLQNKKWKQYDFIAIRLNKTSLAENKVLLNELDNIPFKVFKNNHGEDQVRIYQRSVQ